MEGLYKLLWDRVDTNARRAVDVYLGELPDFRVVAENAAARTAMLDFAVLLRRREAELAADGAAFAGEDLAMLTAFGEQRGAQGISLASGRRVLDLHDVLTLREIHEAAGLHEVTHVTEMIGWLPAAGLAGKNAYLQGFLTGQQRGLSFVERASELAVTLLDDGAAPPGLPESLDMVSTDRYLITVVRFSGGPLPSGERRDEIAGTLLKRHRVPMLWREPGELIALFPCGEPETARERALGLVRDCAEATGRQCAAGAATGRVHALRDTASLARRISRVAPVETRPARLPVMTDVFVELGVARLPPIDDWLRGIARRLETGPDLVATLDAYYRHDMNRLHTAAALHIHPRTLDYRFRRVRELTGLEPGSFQGVRVLGAVIARVLARRWS
ncbi:PucR family transcriptional regulator [Amycolatopsis orientalis]|uniref:PucR family transcriptional regulator n=1 Tax=Amycolatopsis orientalis TaxID=31958 RepID=UPI00040B0FA2|nr:helix-turn-helix domain-containing protein [Amycolatopsis orientalis]